LRSRLRHRLDPVPVSWRWRAFASRRPDELKENCVKIVPKNSAKR
jgi:hypothetical protein